MAFGQRQYTVDEAADRVRYDAGGQLATGENVVADRQFLVHDFVDDPLVNALVVAAEQDKSVVPEILVGDLLGEGTSPGREIDHPALFVGGSLGGDGAVAVVNGRCRHQHAASSAVGSIVHAAVLVFAVIPDVGCPDVDDAGFPRPADDAGGDYGLYHLGEQRQNVDFHSSIIPSISATRTAGESDAVSTCLTNAGTAGIMKVPSPSARRIT